MAIIAYFALTLNLFWVLQWEYIVVAKTPLNIQEPFLGKVIHMDGLEASDTQSIPHFIKC